MLLYTLLYDIHSYFFICKFTHTRGSWTHDLTLHIVLVREECAIGAKVHWHVWYLQLKLPDFVYFSKPYLCFFFPFQISRDIFPYSLALPIEGRGNQVFCLSIVGEKVGGRKKERNIFLVENIKTPLNSYLQWGFWFFIIRKMK